MNVYVDGKFAAGLNLNEIARLGLYNGQEITRTELDKIVKESEFGKLFNAAVNFLSFRPRSEKEIRDYLKKRIKGKESRIKKKKESPPDSEFQKLNPSTTEVITKLSTLGQVNDEAFARWFIDQRHEFKLEGERAIKYELLKKGVDRKLIDRVFASSEDAGNKTETEETLARRAVKKKFKTADFCDRKTKIKAQRFLLSRGFNWETVSSVIEKLSKKD